MSINGPRPRFTIPLVATAITAFFALRPEIKQPEELTTNIKNDINAVLDGGSSDSAPFHETTTEVPPTVSPAIQNLLAKYLAKNGHFEGAKGLIDAYDSRQNRLLNPPKNSDTQINGDKMHQQILDELGISDDAYKLYRRVTDFKARMKLIDNEDDAFDKVTADKPGEVYLGEDKAAGVSYGQLSAMMTLLCEQASGPSGAYDPLFLDLIDMDAQGLKDFTQSIYAYFASKKSGKEWIKSGIAYLKSAYGL